MKILYFHQHFTTPTSGGGTRSYEFAKKLIERGHEVTIVCGESYDFELPIKVSRNVYRGNVDGIDLIQIKLRYSNSDGLAKRTMIFLSFALKSLRIAIKEKYDLLFATSTPLTAGIPGIYMKLFKRRKIKFVFEVRDLWPELPKALGLKNPLLLAGMSILEKLSYRYSDSCIGLSPGICDGIRKKLKQHKTVKMIPNGCDLDLFKPDYGGKLILSGVSKTDTVAVFTGAHGIANGLNSLLDVASELKQRNREDIKIVFIGDGKLKKDLINRAKLEELNNCLFFNPVSKIELKDIVAKADIGLMILKNVPEFYYGTSPNKFFDYISSGIPVLNNYPGWLADMIKSNNCGEVVEPENPIEFANVLEKLADNPQLRINYGENSRKLAEKTFSRKKLSNEFVDFLENEVGNN